MEFEGCVLNVGWMMGKGEGGGGIEKVED